MCSAKKANANVALQSTEQQNLLEHDHSQQKSEKKPMSYQKAICMRLLPTLNTSKPLRTSARAAPGSAGNQWRLPIMEGVSASCA
eukprot:1160247-Pelagomonas_calceolata.AAC.10